MTGWNTYWAVQQADIKARAALERSVWFRRRNGRGSVKWGDGYTSDIEAVEARDACYREIADATLVWVLRSDSQQAVGTVLHRDL